jgi:hypothetical protein
MKSPTSILFNITFGLLFFMNSLDAMHNNVVLNEYGPNQRSRLQEQFLLQKFRSDPVKKFNDNLQITKNQYALPSLDETQNAKHSKYFAITSTISAVLAAGFFASSMVTIIAHKCLTCASSKTVVPYIFLTASLGTLVSSLFCAKIADTFSRKEQLLFSARKQQIYQKIQLACSQFNVFLKTCPFDLRDITKVCHHATQSYCSLTSLSHITASFNQKPTICGKLWQTLSNLNVPVAKALTNKETLRNVTLLSSCDFPGVKTCLSLVESHNVFVKDTTFYNYLEQCCNQEEQKNLTPYSENLINHISIKIQTPLSIDKTGFGVDNELITLKTDSQVFMQLCPEEQRYLDRIELK